MLNAYAVILQSRGITVRPPYVTPDLELRDDRDGRGLRVVRWNTAVLGPEPTPIDLEAITAQQMTDATVTAAAEDEGERKDLVATCALIAKLTTPGWASMTIAQRVQAVRGLVADWKTFRIFVEQHL